MDSSALVVGFGLMLATAAIATGNGDAKNKAKRLMLLGPLWIAQVALTVLATADHRGIAPIWLWAWVFLPTALGASPPALAVARLVRGRGDDPAAVQRAAQSAWAGTMAGPGWELRRTPPLPQVWPPPPDGQAIWYCYAERDGTPAAIDVAQPWARIRLAPRGKPTVERLSDTVEWFGLQGIKPLDPATLDAFGPAQNSLVDAIALGDPDGVLTQALSGWRALNGCIASHPAVAPHLPSVTIA